MFPLSFKNFTPINLIESIISPTMCQINNPVFNWLTFGKIPENPIVTPTTAVQVVTPSAINRYLQSVTVEATSAPTP